MREKEIETDNRDRQRERDELDELKKRLIEKGILDDVEVEAKRVSLRNVSFCFLKRFKRFKILSPISIKIQSDENVKLKTKYEKLDEEEGAGYEALYEERVNTIKKEKNEDISSE